MRLTLALLVVALLAISTIGGATMAITSGGSGGIKGPKTPSWLKNTKSGGNTGGWTEEAKAAYGSRYGQPEPSGAYFNQVTGQLSTPATRFTETVNKLSGASAFNAAVPAWASEARFNNAVAARPNVMNQPAQGPTTFLAGGGSYARTPTGKGVNISDKAMAARDANYNAYIDAMMNNRENTFNQFGVSADKDVGMLTLGNWLGDYYRSLFMTQPPTNDQTGYDWWGRRGGGYGGGYGAGYNSYVPNWMTGLFQLNANR